MYDEIQIFFKDGTTDFIDVREDEDVNKEIAAYCEDYGILTSQVKFYSIIDTFDSEGERM